MAVSQRPVPRIGYKMIEVAGYEVNTRYYTDNKQIMDCEVLLGPPNRPGIRLKDGDASKHERRRVRQLIATELGLPLYVVGAATRYTGGAPPVSVPNVDKFAARRTPVVGSKKLSMPQLLGVTGMLAGAAGLPKAGGHE